MKHSRSTYILASLLILSVLGNRLAANTCDWMPCFESYEEIKWNNPLPSEICPHIIDAWNCIYQLTDCGFEPALLESKKDLSEKSEEYNCTIPEEPTTDPPPTSTPVSCPSKLSQLPLLPIQNLSIADIALKRQTPLCPRYSGNACGDSSATRHCSVYTYSHILPFDEDNIQSFTLPGSYYILSHDKGVKIEIFTAVSDIRSPHSLSVQKIKVTIQSQECTLGGTFNYTATTSNELPTLLTTDTPILAILNYPVELNVNQDRTVASIIASWLGLTVIIRRHSSHLSIVIQMPAELAAESEGLCSTGVPTHSRYSASEVAAQNCNASDYNYAIDACTRHANLIVIVPPETAVTYSYTCTYDILQASSYELLSQYIAIWSDLQLLPSEGICIFPNPHEQPEKPVNNINLQPSNTSSIFPTTTTTTTTTTHRSIMQTTTIQTGLNPTSLLDRIQDGYSSAESSFKRPSLLLVLSLCLCLLLTIMLS